MRDADEQSSLRNENMSKTPIEMMLDGLTWVEVPNTRNISEDDGMPYTTHSGELDFMGRKLRCYRLSDGKAVINADDLNAFFEELAE